MLLSESYLIRPSQVLAGGTVSDLGSDIVLVRHCVIDKEAYNISRNLGAFVRTV